MRVSSRRSPARRLTLALCVFAVASVAAALAPEPGVTALGTSPIANKFIGANKCKNCHQAETSGHQYKTWAATAHAKAFETLASDKAKEFGKVRGIENPQESEDCLVCHVTGYGEAPEMFARSFKTELGVQCESCHGQGERHFKARLSAAFDDEEEDDLGLDDSEPGYTAPPAGEINANPTTETCLTCHNERSPAYKPFCFCDAMPKIRHLNPLKPRTAEQLAELEPCKAHEECEERHGCTSAVCKPPVDG